MKVHEVKPSVDDTLLSDPDFADAYAVAITDRELGALKADRSECLRTIRDGSDSWLDLRNMIVAPFGLKTSVRRRSHKQGMIGIFPILCETPARLVVGFNDSHLDFRVVVDVAPSAESREVIPGTLLKTHHLLGRIYLVTILPFHRRILRNMLQRLVSSPVDVVN